MSTILLTGASGFIGQSLALRLAADGHRLRLALRSPLALDIPAAEVFRFEGLSADTDWTTALAGVEVVVHCAGRTHVMKESAADALAEYRRVNLDGSARLGAQAARAGVRRFVFVSTVKVWGERSRQPFTVDTPPAPTDPYAISKLEAERALSSLTACSGMEVVIVRPPLVYGPGVKANFLRMMQWLDRGRPLPLAGVDGQRSLAARANLVDLLARCVEHPAAANQILPVSDGEDLSMPDLLRRLGAALGKPARLLRVPPWLLDVAARLLGRRDYFEKLSAPLQVDIGHTKRLLDWSPPMTVDEALKQTVAYFLEQRQK
ncbi:MAG: SDR family oxidoreductase [Azoarcus sp.]|jgi:UDP-glucose 4-epimerase|nr:SDR family oxidoreductase [Azoarcus sp.]